MNKKYINSKVNPGTDFYKFATGNWLKYNPQPSDKPSWGSFEVISEKVVRQLYDMILDNYRTYNPGTSKENKKIADFWYLMTNYEKRNSEGISVLKPYIDKLRSLDNVNDILKFCISEMRSELFMSVGVTPDTKNSTHYEVEICQLLALGNREYYVGEDKSTLNKFIEVMNKIMVDAGYSESEAKIMIEMFIKYETMIAEVAYDAETLEHPELNYHMMSIEEASKITNVPLDVVLKWYGMDKTKKLNIAQVEPVVKAFEILNELSVDELKKLVEFVIVTDNADKTSENFGEIGFEFTKFMSGAKQRPERWKREVSRMNSVFGEMLGKQYVSKYFSEDAKNKMIELVNNLKDSFSDIIDAQTWMSDETKEVAKDKLKSMTYKIGYPDKWKDYSDMPIDTEKSYLDNCLAIHRYYHERMLNENYNKDVDKEEWLMCAHTVNAYYSPTSNEICFPAGILQGDFFDIDASDAENYGGIGVVIGHEMTHGFDTCGRLFNKEGNMKDWWSDEDSDKFNALTVTTKDQFNSLEVMDGLKANGDLTLNENLADCGGLKIAYHALEKKMNTVEKEVEKIIEEKGWRANKRVIYENNGVLVDGFSWKQAFFISYATVWAGTETEEIIRHQTLNNCHSLHFMRVNGTLPMFDAWYDAFDITEKNNLFVEKDKRNQLWSV